MRPFAGARPHGHPPLSLRPPFWRPPFYPISPSAARARSPRRRCRPRHRRPPVRPLGPQQSPPAHSPDSLGRARWARRAHFAERLARDRCSPGHEPRAIPEEAVVVRRPYCGNRLTAHLFRAGLFYDFGYRCGRSTSREASMRFRLSVAAAGLALCLAVLWPAFAASTDDQFKSDIEGFLNTLSTTTHGIVSWEGSDSFEMRREGDAAVATITNARAKGHEAKPAELVFDHVDIRRMPVAGTPSAARYDIAFPTQSTLTLADGTKTSLSLKEAKASLTLDE